jgi:hypothetical protein
MLTCTAVNFGNDMIDLERKPIAILRYVAVFATLPGTPPDQCLQGAFDACLMCPRFSLPITAAMVFERASGLGLHDVQQVADQLVFAGFGLFFGG